MNGAAHTPGPWSLYAHDLLVIVNADGSSLGEMKPGDPFIAPETALANATLAASAPNLLERLQRSHGALRAVFIGTGTSGGSCSCCGTIWQGHVEQHEPTCQIGLNEAAIALATGGAA
jgi:hypothetical protein